MLPRYDTIQVSKFLHFETFASLTGTCIEDLQRLNPSIQRNAIPETRKTYSFYVPAETKETLALNRVAILDSASRIGKKELEVLAHKSEGSTYGRDRIVYKVRSGDVLGSIAIRHGVRVADLKKWNNLRGNNIRVGQRLNVWRKQGNSSNAMVASNKSGNNATPVAITGSKTYVVQPGDTLWDISKKFEGLTIDKIKSLNNLGNAKIKAGQKLIIGI